MDENQILTQSIGEHSVTAIGREHLRSLTVTFDARDASCVVVVVLEDNSNEEQLRAIDRLLDIQMLFVEEASIEIRVDDEVQTDHERERHTLSQRQYSLA